MKGLVKWFSNEKGYGFITSDDGEDHYFNIQNVIGATLPSNGDSVDFESKKGNKGLRATDVNITRKSINQRHSNTRRDDRISCPSCYKKIVPRMVMYRGDPSKSVCPYCGTTVKRFRGNTLEIIVLVIILGIFFIGMANS